MADRAAVAIEGAGAGGTDARARGSGVCVVIGASRAGGKLRGRRRGRSARWERPSARKISHQVWFEGRLVPAGGRFCAEFGIAGRLGSSLSTQDGFWSTQEGFRNAQEGFRNAREGLGSARLGDASGGEGVAGNQTGLALGFVSFRAEPLGFGASGRGADCKECVDSNECPGVEANGRTVSAECDGFR